MLAGVAVAAFLQRPEVGFEFGALDVVPAVACEDRAVAPAAGGGHAVERVAAVLHAGEDVVDRGDAEDVPWPVLRHLVADPRAVSGISSQIHAQMSPMMRFSIAPPMPTPSKSSEAICDAARRRRSS